MSLLQSGRFLFAFSACVGLGGIGATYMTTGHLWLGLIMTLLGVLVPLPFYWTHLKRARIILVPEDSQEGGGIASLPADLWGYLIVVGLTIFLGGYVFLSESAKSENRGLREEATEMRTQLSTTKAQLAELQKRLTPGCLTREEETRLIKALSASAPHAFYIHYASGDLHAVTCAESFQRVFQGAQWVERNYLPEDFEASQKGLLVRVKDATALPPGAAVLVRALEQHDIEVTVETAPVWSTYEYDVFALYVGYKP